MNRFRTYGALDDVPDVVGDGTFAGLDMLTDPAMLDAGVVALAENIRFDVNGAGVRGGMARLFPAGTTPMSIYAVGVFKPTEADDYLVFATGSLLVTFNLATRTFRYYAYPAGETVTDTDKVWLVQAGIGSGTLPQLFILRGVDKTVLRYDADNGNVTVAADFAQGNVALYYQDRIAVGQEQAVPVSNLLDFTVFNTLNQFQILKGGNDFIQGFLPYQKDYVLIGTRQGWYVAFFDPLISATAGAGYSGGLQDTSFLRQLTSEAGPLGPDAMLEAMGLVWFISDAAIYAFAPQLDNELTVLGKPISAPIQPIMDRLCVTYSRKASIKRYGYRLYFALPISDEPLDVVTVTVTEKFVAGILLPFTLPTLLSTGSIATIETDGDHGLAVGERVLLAGAVDGALSGEFGVFAVVDNTHFQVRLNASSNAIAGTRMTAQRLATRNTRIAVYNLNNKQWESVDVLPAGFHADFLRVVEHDASRRLVVVDADNGAFLYEGAAEDEVGSISGGIELPFTLPIVLSAFNFATQPVAGRLVTRCYRWGAQPRKITRAEVRSTLDDASALTMTLTARTPGQAAWTGQRSFTRGQFNVADAPLRKICGKRALEAQMEITTSGGSPVVRSVVVETVNAGRPEE